MEKLNKAFTPRVLRLVGACGLAFGMAAVANHAIAASAKIATTKHNLGSTQVASNNRVTDTAEICVFCHTPHAANISNTAAPLWNKTFPATAYTMYNGGANKTSTMDSEVLAAPGNVSQACLSCHDGTQAMDNIINAPGSGGYNATGGGAGGLAYNWGASPRIDGGGLGKLTGIADLGADLSNDHPIGIQYCGGGPTPGAAGSCKDPDFVAPTRGAIGGVNYMWVDTAGGTAGRDKTDMILFNRNFPVAGVDGASVECASCHDVHGGAVGSTFLRISNSGSAVCLACHDK